MKIEKLIVSNGVVNEWNPNVCSMSGTLQWEHPENENIIYGTPDWENEDGLTPFDVADVNGDYNSITAIKLYGTDDEQYNQYKKVLVQIINTLI